MDFQRLASVPWTRGLREKAQSHIKRSPSYGIVSIVCALIYNGIMIGLDRLGVHYAVSQAVSAAVLLPVGYTMQAQLTFNAGRSWRDFCRYSAALVTNYPVAIAVLWLMCDWLKLDMFWASPISMVVLFIWNYATSTWAFSLSGNKVSRG